MNPFKVGDLVKPDPSSFFTMNYFFPDLKSYYVITQVTGNLISIDTSEPNWHYGWWVKSNSGLIKERLGVK